MNLLLADAPSAMPAQRQTLHVAAQYIAAGASEVILESATSNEDIQHLKHCMHHLRCLCSNKLIAWHHNDVATLIYEAIWQPSN